MSGNTIDRLERPLRLNDENSRGKVQNVHADSSDVPIN
jgi:hypothetical protein